MVIFQDFRKAIVSWRRVAVRKLNSDLTNFVYISAASQWRKCEDGCYRVESDPVAWNKSRLEELKSLPQWAAIEKSVEANDNLKKHFGNHISSAFIVQALTLDEVVYSLLPKPIRTENRSSISLDNTGFETKYKQFENFVNSDTISVNTLWILSGIHADKPIQLADNITLRALSDEEFRSCLQGGIILPTSPNFPLFTPEQANRTGLFFNIEYPKKIGSSPVTVNKDEVTQRTNAKKAVIENLQTVGALLGIDNIGVSSMRAEAYDWTGRFSAFMFGGGLTPSTLISWGMNEHVVDEKSAKKIRSTWQWLVSQSDTQSTNLILAARRLGYANERFRVEDRLLDAMIAAEELYLGGTDNGELRYKLSLRTALWANPTALGVSKLEVSRFMKKAYDARSAIAHGSRPDTNALKLANDTLSIDKFTDFLVKVVQEGLNKAIHYAKRHPSKLFDPPWDDMVLK